MSAGGEKIKISVRGLSVAYGGVTALKGLDLDIQTGEILSIIGPSNSGKTSFLRSLNRMNELNLHARTIGTVLLDGCGATSVGATARCRTRIVATITPPTAP